MTGIILLRCFKTVTVVLAHPVWQTLRPLWYKGLGLRRDKGKRDQAVRALVRFFRPDRRHGKWTIISPDFFIEDIRLPNLSVGNRVSYDSE